MMAGKHRSERKRRVAAGCGTFVAPIRTRFGTVRIYWRVDARSGARVLRIVLGQTVERTLGDPSIAGAGRGSCGPIGELGEKIVCFLRGENVTLPLSLADFARCSPFQRRVLLAEHRIPRGRVSTYGRIAQRLGLKRGARAVGRALARNPFPLLIPCHRAVQRDGSIGGYQGGPKMKRRLLEMEGVRFDAKGRVKPDYIG